jgi:hypothetical protein
VYYILTCITTFELPYGSAFMKINGASSRKKMKEPLPTHHQQSLPNDTVRAKRMLYLETKRSYFLRAVARPLLRRKPGHAGHINNKEKYRKAIVQTTMPFFTRCDKVTPGLGTTNLLLFLLVLLFLLFLLLLLPVSEFCKIPSNFQNYIFCYTFFSILHIFFSNF